MSVWDQTVGQGEFPDELWRFNWFAYLAPFWWAVFFAPLWVLLAYVAWIIAQPVLMIVRAPDHPILFVVVPMFVRAASFAVPIVLGAFAHRLSWVRLAAARGWPDASRERKSVADYLRQQRALSLLGWLLFLPFRLIYDATLSGGPYTNVLGVAGLSLAAAFACSVVMKLRAARTVTTGQES